MQNAFDEGVQRKAKTILNGRVKEVDHLGNENNIRHEEIRTPDLDAGGRSISSSEGFSVRGLNLTRAHDLRVPHDDLQIFRATGIPNLVNLVNLVNSEPGGGR